MPVGRCISIAFAAVLFGTAISAAAQELDLAIVGAHVISMDARHPAATAVGVIGDRIAVVGSDDEVRRRAGKSTRIIDAKGRDLLPGFIESHGHFAGLGATRRIVDLAGTTSYNEVIRRTRAAAEALPPGTWVVGRGWDQNLWPEKSFPVHDALSAATPTHPVWLVRVDGHAGLANETAMRLAGLNSDTHVPEGGEVIRGDDLRATGVFVDAAMPIVSRLVPENDAATVDGDLLAAQARCFAEGITSFHDAGASQSTIDRMAALMENDNLRIRLYVMLGGSSVRTIQKTLRPPIIGAHGNRLTVRSLKLGVDGALGSRGAALLEDYSDRPNHRGLVMLGKKDLMTFGRAALTNGYQVCVHAIGDAGNRLVVDAWDELFATMPQGREARFRIEHLQIVDADDIPRIARLGLIASMQGVHCTSDMPWVPTRIGEDRTLEGAYVWKKFLDRGVVLCNGTDAPVENVSVFECLYASITRQSKDGTPEGGWQPDQRLSRLEALHSYTQAGAYAAFEENLKGSITPGKLADLVLIDVPVLTCAERDLLRAGVVTTIVGGRVVHERP